MNQWDGIIGKTMDDPYFEYRDNVWIGYEVSTQSDLKDYNNTAFRYKWYKIINGTGGKPYGWYPPPGDGKDIKGVDVGLEHYVFDLENDPFEHNNITNDTLLEKLYSMMITMEKNGVPQAQVDTNCPQIVHPNNSAVGPYWWPWCGM